MMRDEVLARREGEDAFEHKLRLCRAKIEHKIDADWQEIADALGLDIHYDTLRKAAYGLIEYDDHVRGQDPKMTRILSVSDLHVPFQKPVSTFEQYAGRVDILQINGDVCDAQSISRFPKTYRLSSMDEMVEARAYLIDLVETIQPKKLMVNYGNHDLRLRDYLARNLDSDIAELMPNTSLELILLDGFRHYDRRTKVKSEYAPLVDVLENIEIKYTDSWWQQIGQTVFCHPMAFSGSPMKTAEKAMQFFRNEGLAFTSLVMAHTHHTGQYKIGNTMLYEQGCCCDSAQMNYADGKLYNAQKEGYVYMVQDSDGAAIPERTRVVYLN